jgi:hypothetical protein
MNNIIKSRLSAKQATKRCQTAITFALSSVKQYTDVLEKYNRTDQEVKTTWMDKTKVLITEIHNMVDITPDALSVHLAAASGYGLNHTSAVFLMIHAAMTGQKYLIPMVDIPVRLSEKRRKHIYYHPTVTQTQTWWNDYTYTRTKRIAYGWTEKTGTINRVNGQSTRKI